MIPLLSSSLVRVASVCCHIYLFITHCSGVVYSMPGSLLINLKDNFGLVSQAFYKSVYSNSFIVLYL